MLIYLLHTPFLKFFDHTFSQGRSNSIEHSNPKIAINFKSPYLEDYSFYWCRTLQEHLLNLYYAELDFCKFSGHLVLPSLKYLIGKYLILPRSECLIGTFTMLWTTLVPLYSTVGRPEFSIVNLYKVLESINILMIPFKVAN